MTDLKTVLKRYFSPEGYLGIYLLCGVMLLLLCGWVFGSIAEDIGTNEFIVRFDNAVVTALHANTNAVLAQLMVAMSVAGSELPLVITIMVSIYFIMRRCWTDLLLLIITVGGAQILDVLLKSFFHRLRPTFADPIALAPGFSFPSGHAMGAMVFYGWLAYVLMHGAKTWLERVLIFLIGAIVVILIGFSRIYLGVHYPSDVIAGYSAGLAWLLFAIFGVEVFRSWHTERQSRRNRIAGTQQQV